MFVFFAYFFILSFGIRHSEFHAGIYSWSKFLFSIFFFFQMKIDCCRCYLQIIRMTDEMWTQEHQRCTLEFIPWIEYLICLVFNGMQCEVKGEKKIINVEIMKNNTTTWCIRLKIEHASHQFKQHFHFKYFNENVSFVCFFFRRFDSVLVGFGGFYCVCFLVALVFHSTHCDLFICSLHCY